MPVKNLSTLLLITLLLASCTTNHSKQPIKQLPSDNLTTKKNIETKEPHHKINWLNKKLFPQALKKPSSKTLSDHEQKEKTFHKRMNRTKNLIDHTFKKQNSQYIPYGPPNSPASTFPNDDGWPLF